MSDAQPGGTTSPTPRRAADAAQNAQEGLRRVMEANAVGTDSHAATGLVWGGTARTLSTSGRSGETVTIRKASGWYVCGNCLTDIAYGDLHGAGAGTHYCLVCCEPIPPAARERQLAERRVAARVHEDALVMQLKAARIPVCTQYQVGRWRWDIVVGSPAKRATMLLVDVQGGLGPSGSRSQKHGSAEGYANDCRKLAEAVRCGYRAIFVTGQQVQSGEALQLIEGLLAADQPPARVGEEGER